MLAETLFTSIQPALCNGRNERPAIVRGISAVRDLFELLSFAQGVELLPPALAFVIVIRDLVGGALGSSDAACSASSRTRSPVSPRAEPKGWSGATEKPVLRLLIALDLPQWMIVGI